MKKIGNFVDSNKVQNTVIVLIILNAISMGLETFPWWRNLLGSGIVVLDHIFIWIFAVELALRLYAHGFSFFKNNWNNFDFIIVAISMVPGNGVFSCFRIIRTMRIFRTMRILGKMENLRMIICSMLNALPSLGWLMLLLTIFFYTFAVLSTTLFGKIAPEQFGTLFSSFYTLFSLMTMEGWQDTVDAVNSPYARVVFIPFILISSYIFLNLVVGIIVSAMEDMAQERNKQKNEKTPEEELTEEVRALSAQVAELKELLQKQK